MVSRAEMPEDYRALLAGSGPGTLAGVPRLLAPGGPDGFDLDEEEEVFPGTLTELLVADMTGTGPDLADFELGDPEEWAWPFWGPDRPRSR